MARLYALSCSALWGSSGAFFSSPSGNPSEGRPPDILGVCACAMSPNDKKAAAAKMRVLRLMSVPVARRSFGDLLLSSTRTSNAAP
jgi:hypothetical protein